MLNKKKNNKGFTLVELLVVIAIIGILAVVAIPALFKNINKAKVADVESDYSAIKSAVLSYYADKNEMPTASWSDELASYMESVPSEAAFKGSYDLLIGTLNLNKKLVLEISKPNMTTEQSNKLVKDIEGKVYQGTSVDNEDVKEVTEDDAFIPENNLYLILIDNTDM